MNKHTHTVDINSVFYTSRDDIRLHVKDYQPHCPSDKLPVICLPGLSRNARDFDRLANFLASHEAGARRVVAFDYRGRGLSAYDPNWENYNIVTEAEDVVAGLTVLGIEHGIFVGTSRGGLITMVLAATRPTAIKGVVLNDIGPAIDGSGLMQIRAYLTHPPKPSNWAEAVESQKALMGKSFPAFSEDDWKHEARCRYQEVDGVIMADYDPKLANTMKAMDAGARLPTAWPQFGGLRKVPLMTIRGENSNILSQKTLMQMSEVHKDLEIMVVEGQGHAPALHTGDIPEKIARFASKIDLPH
jgi:pimeloyl-ACP methyl ester carboxylesterase